MVENKGVIMDTIYENIFDFAETNEEDRIVLELITTPKVVQNGNLNYVDTIQVSFTITKDEMDITLDKLLIHMEREEQYEKCANIIKLKDGLLKPQHTND